MRCIFLYISVLCLAVPSIVARSAHEPFMLRDWSRGDGLWDSYSTFVTVGSSGRIIVNHGDVKNCSILDGSQTIYLPKPNTDSHIIEFPAETFWSLYYDSDQQQGGLLRFENDAWVKYPLALVDEDVLAINLQEHLVHQCYYPLSTESVLFADESQLHHIVLNPLQDKIIPTSEPLQIGTLHSIFPIQKNEFRLTGTKGFAIIQINPSKPNNIQAMVIQQWVWDDLPPEQQIQTFFLQNNDFGAGMLWDANTNLFIAFKFQNGSYTKALIAGSSIENVWPGPYQTLWFIRNKGDLYIWKNRNIKQMDFGGVLEGKFRDIYVDGDSFWITTNYGLAKCSPNLWQSPDELLWVNDDPSYMFEDQNHTIWQVCEDYIQQVSPFVDEKYYFELTNKNASVYSAFPIRDSQIVISSHNYYPNFLQFDQNTKQFQTVSHPDGIPIHRICQLDDESVLVFASPDDVPVIYLERYDGSDWQRIATLPDSDKFMDYRDALQDRNGLIWLARWGEDGLYRLHDQKLETVEHVSGDDEKVILSLLELNDGRILAGGITNLFQFDGTEWSILKNGIEKIRSLALEKDGSIWVASENGVYRFIKNAWLHYTAEDGLPSNYVNRVYVAKDGKVWACTAKGIAFFDRIHDLYVPDTTINQNESAAVAIQNETAAIHFSGVDQWKNTPAERLLFSYRIDQAAWSPFTNQSYTAFNNLSVGTHRFEVRSMDLSRNIDPSPAEFQLEVKPVPLQQQAWFPITVTIVFFALIFSFITTIDAWWRVVKQANELEDQVALRTDDLKKAYKQLQEDSELRKKLEEQLRQSSKLEAIGTLAGGIAHDFNNVLTGIMGFASLIKESLDDKESVKEMSDNILESSKKVSNITKQLLAFSRKQVLMPTEVNINNVLQQIFPLLRNVIQEHIEIQYHCDPDLSKIHIDSSQLEQVILNLAVNARDAMPKGGHLILETKNVGLDESYAREHPEISPGEYAMLSVTDNGEGIPQNILEHIFDPFFTTKEVGAGTGMGLATVHGIVKQSKGSIYVYSELKRGTTFKLYFPKIQNESGIQEDIEEVQPESVVPENCKILLVEDDDNIRSYISFVLQNWGLPVQVAENGERALELMALSPNEIDLLITDLIMPKMGGVELYQRLHEVYPNLKVLFISGYSSNSLELNGHLISDAELLQKPFMPSDLKSAILSVLSQHNN